jgi:peptide/nickel transport system permease protein
MSVVIFILLRMAPGNIVDVLFAAAGLVDPSGEGRHLKELGMDRPYWVQYLEWLRGIVSGELGKSYRYELPTWQLIRPLLPVTLELAALSIAISVLPGRSDRRDQRDPPGFAARLRAPRAEPRRASPCRHSGWRW